MPGRPRAGGQYQECYLTLCPIKSSHPLWGATRYWSISEISRRISILAPLAGCDRYVRACPNSALYFYPRTPCGVRPQI